MMNKKVIAVTATATLALAGLTACGDTNDTTVDPTEANESVASEVASEVETNPQETTYEDTTDPVDDTMGTDTVDTLAPATPTN